LGLILSVLGSMISGAAIFIYGIVWCVRKKTVSVNPVVLLGIAGWALFLFIGITSTIAAIYVGAFYIYNRWIWYGASIAFCLGLIFIFYLKISGKLKYVSWFAYIINILGLGFWFSFQPLLYWG